MGAFALVIFFALILVVGWIFFDEDDWNNPDNFRK